MFRARVVNPRWLEAMRRHGYKGAFEMAATVDYLFGYDATTDVVADWMYEKLAETYVLDDREPASSWTSPTRGRCTASPNGCSRRPSGTCGSTPTSRPSTACGRSISRPKANSKGTDPPSGLRGSV